MQHTYSRTHISPDVIRGIARNFDAFDLNGVNHLVLDADMDLIVQISGYTETRGSFCDVIPFTELKPFLPEGFSPANHPTSTPDSIRIKYSRPF